MYKSILLISLFMAFSTTNFPTSLAAPSTSRDARVETEQGSAELTTQNPQLQMNNMELQTINLQGASFEGLANMAMVLGREASQMASSFSNYIVSESYSTVHTPAHTVSQQYTHQFTQLVNSSSHSQPTVHSPAHTVSQQQLTQSAYSTLTSSHSQSTAAHTVSLQYTHQLTQSVNSTLIHRKLAGFIFFFFRGTSTSTMSIHLLFLHASYRREMGQRWMAMCTPIPT